MEKQSGATVSYTAESLNDIADMFDSLARDKQERRQRLGDSITVRESRDLATAQSVYTDCARTLRQTRLTFHDDFVKRIQDALGTGETGDNLIAVARDSHAAEQELAGIKTRAESVEYERRPELDKRIANGDDYAGDAFVRWVAVGCSPSGK